MSPVQDLIDAADQLAAWEPHDISELFAAIRDAPDAAGALAEWLGVLAAQSEGAVRGSVTDAIDVAAGFTAAAAAGLGAECARWTMLRGSATRWLPGSAA